MSEAEDLKNLANFYELMDRTPWPELTGDANASEYVDRLMHEKIEWEDYKLIASEGSWGR